MREQIQEANVEPELSKNLVEPKGVLRKNLKPMLYLGAAGLVVLAALASSTGDKSGKPKNGSLYQPPQPLLQDATDNNVQDLKAQIAGAHRRTTEGAVTSVPDRASATPGVEGSGLNRQFPEQPCAPGQSCASSAGAAETQQLTPAEQQAEQLAARDRALAYESRFTSNLVFAHAPEASTRTVSSSQSVDDPEAKASVIRGESGTAIPDRVSTGQGAPRSSVPAAGNATTHHPEVNIDAAEGQAYVIYEGTTLDTVLMNSLDGDAAGPVKVLVSNPLYSHDRQHVLIPEGTIVLGEARKIGSSGFGQQRRLEVLFHRMIMPDGYSVDLDQFHGLNQTGEQGLKDKVNNHYLQIFGSSIALGVIAGASEIEQGGVTISASGSQAFSSGASSGLSQSATTILDRFIQIPPTITVREGHRVKVYFTADMLLPAYERHQIPQTF